MFFCGKAEVVGQSRLPVAYCESCGVTMNVWGLAGTACYQKHNYLVIYSPSVHIAITHMQIHLSQWFCVGCNGVFSLGGVVGVFLVYNDMKRKVIFPPADWNVRHQYSVSQLSDEINAALHPSSLSISRLWRFRDIISTVYHFTHQLKWSRIHGRENPWRNQAIVCVVWLGCHPQMGIWIYAQLKSI